MLIENSMECNVRVRPTYVKILQNFHSFLSIYRGSSKYENSRYENSIYATFQIYLAVPHKKASTYPAAQLLGSSQKRELF